MSSNILVYAGFNEFVANDVDKPVSEAVIEWSWQEPSSARFQPNSDGWIDVRRFVRATAVVTPATNDGTYELEGKRGSNDPEVQSIASSSVTAGTTEQIYGDTIEHYSHIRMTHSGAGGTTTASLLVK